MTHKRNILLIWGAAGLFFFACLRVSAQIYQALDEPRLIRGDVGISHVEAIADGQIEQQSSRSSDDTSERRFVDLSASFAIWARGSIYHPNLLSFGLNASEGILKEINATGSEQNQTDVTLETRSYSGSATLLEAKPYSVRFSADRSIGRSSFDYFTRATIEAERYGVATEYQQSRFPLTLSYDIYNEEIYDPALTSTRRDKTFWIRLSNFRSKYSTTRLTVTDNRFTQTDLPDRLREGSRQTVDLSDIETFGEDRRQSLRSHMRYYVTDIDSRRYDVWMLRERLRVKHSPSLASSYNYSFRSSQSDGAVNRSHDVEASLSHQLYASLRSTIAAGGNLRQTGVDGSSSDELSYYANIAEAYTKQLGRLGVLKLNGSRSERRSEVDSQGQTAAILDEAAVLSDDSLTYLAELNIDPISILVTDASGTVLYTADIDYSVVQHGLSTEIRRLSAGRILNGATVLVDYIAANQPSDRFTTTSTAGGFRLEITDWRASLYGNIRTANSYGASAVNVDQTTDRMLGLSTVIGRVSTGLEYQEFESLFSPHRQLRSYQKAAFAPLDGSRLTVDLQQVWSEHTDTGEKREVYNHHITFSKTLMRMAAFAADAGYRIERSGDTKRDSFGAGAKLSFNVVKLRTNLRYSFSTEDENGEISRNHRVYLSVRRKF